MRHAGHEPAPGGSLAGCGSRSPWGPADGPGRMASRQGPRRARQPHAGAPASPSARVEPRREHLAVLARQLFVEPRVRLLRRPRRPLLLRVEPPHRPALDHHVHRPPRLGQCMMISAGWYYIVGIVGLKGPIGALCLVFAATLGALVVPLAGILTDRYGRVIVYRSFAIFQLLIAFAVWWVLSRGDITSIVIVISIALGAGVWGMFGAQGALLPEMFGARHRY